MQNVLNKTKSDFTMVSNKVIRDKNLSLEAKGLFLILWSLPDNWKFIKIDLQNRCNISKNKLEKLLKILENFGYLTRKQVRNEKGHFSYNSFLLTDITPDKQSDSTVGQKSGGGKTVGGKRAPINTNIINTNKILEEDINKKGKTSDINCWFPSTETINFIEITFLLTENLLIEEYKLFKNYVIRNNKSYPDLDSSFIIHIRNGITNNLINIPNI